jgi:hypothetical protein
MRRNQRRITGQSRQSALETLKRFVSVSNLTKCWEWQAARDRNGYGKLHRVINGHLEHYTHRIAYRLLVGEIPDHLEVDHICENPACCNPDHLRLLTHKENQARMALRRTHCPNGHPFDEANTALVSHGGRTPVRICKACRYERIKAWRERHPDKARETNTAQKRKWRAAQREQ